MRGERGERGEDPLASFQGLRFSGSRQTGRQMFVKMVYYGDAGVENEQIHECVSASIERDSDGVSVIIEDRSEFLVEGSMAVYILNNDGKTVDRHELV